MASGAEQYCGVYRVLGMNPGSDDVAYDGQLEIFERGDTLMAHWLIGQEQEMWGVGIRNGDQLSFAFNYLDPAIGVATGIVVYELVGRGRLNGRWTVIGSDQIGRETCEALTKNTEYH